MWESQADEPTVFLAVLENLRCEIPAVTGGDARVVIQGDLHFLLLCASSPVLADQWTGVEITVFQTNLVEIGEDGRIGTHKRCFGVMDTKLGAVLANQLPQCREVRPRCFRKQMVLYLVLESTHEKVHRSTSANIAGHAHLPTEEINLRIMGDGRHADVVGCKRPTQEKSEHQDLDQDKGQCQPEGQEYEQK